MTDPATHPLEKILRLCAEAAPEPWYPSAYAQATGSARDQLDPHLDQLRMAGLIRLTDWVQGRGQGYALTPEGERALQSPRELARIRSGTFTPRAAPEYNPAEGEDTPWNRGEAVRAALLGSSPPVVSLVLIALNVAWFVAGLVIAVRDNPKNLNVFLYGSTEHVLQMTGAVSAAHVYLHGQWWRLLTSCFVHIGLLHLGMNMYGLYVLGPHQERMWGRGRFLVIYLLAGLGGSCFVVAYQPRALLAGASGAIWGIMASELAWIVLNRSYLPPQLVSQWLRQLLSVFVLNAFITFMIPNISAIAHFAGGGVGLVTAILVHYQRFGIGWQRGLAMLGVLAVPLVCLTIVARANPVIRGGGLVRNGAPADNEAGEMFGRILPQTDAAEKKAMTVYREQAYPLMTEDPKERDAEAVKRVVAELERQQAELSAAADLMRKTGPYQRDAVESTRRTLEKLYSEEARLLTEAARCLRQGTDLTDDEFDRQWQAVAATQEVWRNLKK